MNPFCRRAEPYAKSRGLIPHFQEAIYCHDAHEFLARHSVNASGYSYLLACRCIL